MSLGFTEIIIIGIAAVVLLFGGKKITELSKAAGRATGEYKKAKRDIERELANDDGATVQQVEAETSGAKSASKNKTDTTPTNTQSK